MITQVSELDKSLYPEVFFENDEVQPEDAELLERMLSSDITGPEREFFERIKAKIEGEHAQSADLLLDELHNDEEVYIVRYYFDYFKVGCQKIVPNVSGEEIYGSNLSETLDADMYQLLGRHISVLDWLRSIDFKGINYLGNFVYSNDLHG